MTENNLQLISAFIKKAQKYPNDEIEASVISYVSEKTNIPFYYNDELVIYRNKGNIELIEFFKNHDFPISIEFISEFFEALLDNDNITENGIVFTPEYIASYIINKCIKDSILIKKPSIIDPSCGCGIFLATAAKILFEKTQISFKEIFSDCIFGIELDTDNARRCVIVLNLLPLLCGTDNKGIHTNILCTDSLKCNWTDAFEIDLFDYIIGNPPYVNTHDMSKETARYLKSNFITTKSGVYNIFYAFIEHALNFLSYDGVLSYIIPNNFLTIKSATDLRRFIMDRSCLKMILDFAENMVFKPVRTYNCIIQLTKGKNETFDYCVMDLCDSIEEGLSCITFDTMPIVKLDVNGWKLVDKKTRENIQKIESQFISIKSFIRVGIATLKDDVYMVEKDERGFYKNIDGAPCYLEEDLIKRLYKIPDLKYSDDLESICRFIIFPYEKGANGFQIINEQTLKTSYPNTYNYLLSKKPELDSRDKGKPNPVAWYAYGRTQGLNKFGKKLLFPTFANKPRFALVNDEFAFFVNGYAVFENDYLDLDLLCKILNSDIMQYYVSNTSYAIEGGYYCYQKKYIERFSIPLFNPEETEKLLTLSDQELNEFLINKYQLDI